MTTSTSSTAPGPSAADQAAVAGVPQRIVSAWAAHDSKAFGEVFVPDGTMILPGVFLTGREEIGSFMGEAFAGVYRGTQVTGQPLNLRFLSEDAALLITIGGVLAAGQSEVSKDQAIRASWLVVKRDGQWSLAAYQNSPRDAD
jgi:uncharacterized protein (TIGR02246 family)